MNYLYETVPLGSFWQGEVYVYEVTETWPSIGGTTFPKFRLTRLNEGTDLICNYNEMRANRLKQIDPEEVPMALLGAA